MTGHKATDDFFRKLAVHAMKRQHRKPLDKRGVGRCGLTLRWGYREDPDIGVIRPYITRLGRDGKVTELDKWYVDMRGMKRHNRHAWVLFKFCQMLAFCDQGKDSPIILMDSLTMMTILQLFVGRTDHKIRNPLPTIIHDVTEPKADREARQWKAHQPALTGGIPNRTQITVLGPDPDKSHRGCKPVLTSRMPKALNMRMFALCCQCRTAFHDTSDTAAKQKIDGTWSRYGLFSCPHHYYNLSLEPSFQCPYRAEMLVTSQDGAEAMLAELAGQPMNGGDHKEA
jgi:hypothetical protein